jgi:dopamine receptor D1
MKLIFYHNGVVAVVVVKWEKMYEILSLSHTNINIIKSSINIFTVCWVPFFCVNIVAAFCKTCIGGQTFKILSWLGYSNSAFNPIIYSIFNTEFRAAFKRILTTKAAFCCAEDINYHCRNSERFVTDYQSAKCSHIHSGRSSAELEQVSAI